MVRMSRPRNFTVYGSVLVLVVAGYGAYYFSQQTSEVKDVKSTRVNMTEQLAEFYDSDSGVRMNHPMDVMPSMLSEADKKANILLRLEQKQPPGYLVTLRTEAGLRGPAQLARVDTLELVTNGAEASLAKRYPGYALLSKNATTVGGKSATEFMFTYDGVGGAGRVQQRLVLIAITSDKALYISQQCPQGDFITIDSNVFSSMMKSITTPG